MNILFDKSLKDQFLSSQKLSTDSLGYVIDTKSKKRVLDETKRPIRADHFAGIRRGSLIFLARDIETIIREATLDTKQP